MKTLFLFAIALISFAAHAQNTWTQKADYGGGAMDFGIAFSIGNKGYMGIGYFASSNQIWEYDPGSDTWTQVADFPGEARGSAASFSIGSKGYLGTGYDVSTEKELKDFWEYDPEINTWTQKADFGGGKRWIGVGFSIGEKGYLGLGDHNDFYRQDIWEYDPATDAWTQKADFGGGPREGAVAFTTEGKGYVGCGLNGASYLKDFWEYDPLTNVWTQKSDFGGAPRFGPVGFSIEQSGYIGTGFYYDHTVGNIFYKDFWEYNVSNDTWIKVADFGGAARFSATGFSINGKGYAGTGDSMSASFKDFWEYSPDTSSTCSIASGEFADNITNYSAKLHWSEVSGAEGYKVRYKVAGTSSWTKKTTSDTSKKISGLQPNTEYVWEVKTYCSIAPNASSAWSEKQYFTTLPARLSSNEVLSTLQVSPNPFSTSASISFDLSKDSHTVIELFDLAGKKMKTLFDAPAEAGEHLLPLNREQLAAGIYFLQIKMNQESTVLKVAIQ